MEKKAQLNERRILTRREQWMSLKLICLVASALLIGGCGDQSAVISTTEDGTNTLDGQETTSTATASSTEQTSTTLLLDPRVQESALVAEKFMRAFAAQDMNAIEATSVEGHVFGLLVDQFSRFDLEFAWRDAVGWELEVNECMVENPDIENMRFVCSVSHETDWSRALGVGPYESEFYLGVRYPGTESWIYPDRDTPTVTDRAFAQFPEFLFKSESWTPFLTWLGENHPNDMATMFSNTTFADIGLLPGEPLPALSPESIALWDQSTREFVESAIAD